ncbi:MAG: hypothetical protein LUF89_02870 [Ruminococcus sp.]|nr:hypothetical protein [Ruminococcus sp.]
MDESSVFCPEAATLEVPKRRCLTDDGKTTQKADLLHSTAKGGGKSDSQGSNQGGGESRCK